MKEPEPSPEYGKFKALLGRVLAVPHEEIVRREDEYQRQVTQKPIRRGPKPQKKPFGLAPAARNDA